MKVLAWWWNYLTSPSFRHWTHMHDMESFMSEIERMRREMLEYESKMIFNHPN